MPTSPGISQEQMQWLVENLRAAALTSEQAMRNLQEAARQTRYAFEKMNFFLADLSERGIIDTSRPLDI